MKTPSCLRGALGALLSALIFAVTTGSASAESRHPRRKADLSRLVVLGDSLLAGYQNGSLRGAQQTNGIAALIARQAGVPLALPLIDGPGIPNALALLDPGPPLVIAPLPGVSTGRVNPTEQPFNLAVPGHTVLDALQTRPAPPFDNLTDLLGLPGLLGGISRSQVEWAEALQPSTLIVWLGSNDVLGAALAADASLVTSLAEFTIAYAELMRRLDATGAALVVANIPDVTVIPYLTSAEDVAVGTGAPLAVIGPALGLAAGDFVTPGTLSLIPAILTGMTPGPLPAGVVLTAAEVESIQAATRQFNDIIKEQARAHGAALVDTHRFLNRLKRHGLSVGRQRLTTDFLGGIFSLDGFHPSNTGAAATANEFIREMNARLHTGLRKVKLRSIAESDPLVLPAPAPAANDCDDD